jgi:hypothetical protein
MGLIWLLLLEKRSDWVKQTDEFVSVFLDLTPEELPRPAQVANVQPAPPPAVARRVAPIAPIRATALEAAPILLPAVAPNNVTDWTRAREDAARRTAAALAGPKPRGFGKVEPSRPFRVCRRPKSHFEWDPDVNKPMLEKLLPTFKVGKRCTVMPPFFGCVLGELPPPNGKLLDEMRDPDRPTSSVPSEADCLPDEVPLP